MRQPSKRPSFGLRFYAFLVKFYPLKYQQAFGAQMLRTFQDFYTTVLEEQGRIPLTFWINVIGDEITWIVKEQVTAFTAREDAMNKLGSNGKQWGAGIIAGLALVAASIIFSLFQGRAGTVVLYQPALVLVMVLGVLVVAIALLGKALAKLFKGIHYVGPLVALMNHWRTAAGLLGAILLPMFVYGGFSLLAPSTAPCAGKIIAQSTPPAQFISAQDYFQQGDYEYDQGNCSQAIAAYTQSIALNPQNAEAYNNRAYTYMVLQQYDKALLDLNKAIEIRRDYVNALMNRGDIYNYYYAINYDRAIADYDRVMSIDLQYAQHTSVTGHMLLACVHRGDITQPWKVLQVLPNDIGPDCQSLSHP